MVRCLALFAVLWTFSQNWPAICSQTPPLILPFGFGVRAVPGHQICGQLLISNRIFRQSVLMSHECHEAALVIRDLRTHAPSYDASLWVTEDDIGKCV